MQRLLAILLSVIGSAALAQTTGTVNPNPAPARPSVNQEVPPGGCMPIGLTASGEMVFPILCTEFIERHRGMTSEQSPATVDEKPPAVEEKPAALEEKAAAKQTEIAAPENSQPANKTGETVPTSKRVEKGPHERAASLEDCAHYRTYDPASGTYRGHDGQRRSCRKVGVLTSK